MQQKIQLKYQHTYDCGAYGTWPAEIPFPKAYEIFSYYGHRYMIKPSEMCSRYDLFIYRVMVVTQGYEIEPLMSFYGTIYTVMVW